MSFPNLKVSLAPALVFAVAFAAISRADDGADTLVEEFVGPEHLMVSGSVDLGVSVTDNRDRIDEKEEAEQYQSGRAGRVYKSAPRKKERQTEFHVGPKIRLTKSVTDRIDFSLSYSPVFTWWNNVKKGADEFRVNHTLRANLDYQVSPRTSFGLNDKLWWSGQRDIYYGDDVEWEPDREDNLSSDEHFLNNAKAWVRRDFGDDDYVKISGKYRIKRYDDDEKARYADEDEWVVRGDWVHSVTRRLDLGVFAEYTAWDRRSDGASGDLDMIGQERGENAPSVDQGVNYLEIGVEGKYDFSGHNDHVLYAATGWTHYWYEADGLDDKDRWGATRVELRLFQQRDTRLFIGGRYGHVYSETYPFSSQNDLSGYMTVRQYMGKDRDFSLAATVEVRRRVYNIYKDLDPDSKGYGYWKRLLEETGGDTEYDRDTLYLHFVAKYEFTKWFSANAYYTFRDVDADVGMGFKENVFGVNANVKFF